MIPRKRGTRSKDQRFHKESVLSINSARRVSEQLLHLQLRASDFRLSTGQPAAAASAADSESARPSPPPPPPHNLDRSPTITTQSRPQPVAGPTPSRGPKPKPSRAPRARVYAKATGPSQAGSGEDACRRAASRPARSARPGQIPARRSVPAGLILGPWTKLDSDLSGQKCPAGARRGRAGAANAQSSKPAPGSGPSGYTALGGLHREAPSSGLCEAPPEGVRAPLCLAGEEGPSRASFSKLSL